MHPHMAVVGPLVNRTRNAFSSIVMQIEVSLHVSFPSQVVSTY